MKLSTERRIGFFFLNKDWAQNIYNNILANTTDIMRFGDMYIETSNGTRVDFIKASKTMARGMRFDEVYIEPTIKQDVDLINIIRAHKKLSIFFSII